jgi:urease accessory protein
MNRTVLLRAIIVALAVLQPSFACAHTGHEFVGHMWTGDMWAGDMWAGSLMYGLAHPVGGLDHLCAMLAVGLWAAQIGGRALWVLPLTFVGMMALGAGLTVSGYSLPFDEPGIVLSVLLLGSLVSAAIRLPLWLGSSIVGLFALWHGHAHGAEFPEFASGMAYAAGFVLATAALHIVGIAFGLGMRQLARERFVRYAGAGVALFGVYLAAM